MPDNEIVINIKNTVDVTNQNKPNTTKKEDSLNPKKPKKTEEEKQIEQGQKDALLIAKGTLKYGSKVASLVGIDTSAIQRVTSYGFSVAKVVEDVGGGSYGSLVMLALQIASEALERIKSASSECNALDEARISSGVMDVSNKTIRVNKITGRYKYNRR